VTFTAAGLSAAPTPAASGLELTFRADPTVYDGRFANNGWLQELPKPFDKVCWDNVAYISPRTAERFGLTAHGPVVYGVEVEVVEIVYNGHTLQAPVWILPGQPDDSIGVTIGYGRTAAGRVGDGLGFNANFFRYSATPWTLSGVEVRKANKTYHIASTQGHFQMDGRALLRVGTKAQYEKDPHFAAHMAHEPAKDMTMYPDWKYEGYKWGMSIDLNTCDGCNACVVACVAENNIPVVGKLQVMKGREMHWLRIDRYWEGSPDNPSTHFQPVRGGVSGWRDSAQQRGPERHGLQPLRRHALLLAQLPLQGAALQLPALRRLGHPVAQDAAQSRRHGAQPRRDGKVHLLRAADQRGAGHGQARRSEDSRR
jgi:ferredoxin